MKRVILSCLFLLLVLGACESEKKEPGPASKCVCILVDLSYSTHNRQMRRHYVQDVHKIIDSLHAGDVIVVGFITDKSLYELDFCIAEELPIFNPKSKSPLYQKAERKKFTKALAAHKDSLFRQAESAIINFDKKIMKTEIMGGLLVAERVFANYRKPKKVLVILSDMLEDSRRYNFHREKLNEKRRQAIIQAEKRNGNLPDLTGVRVYVAGASAATADQYADVRSFWLAYFDRCGATLRPKDYGSILIKFDE